MRKDKEKARKIAQWHLKRSVSTESIKMLWEEIKQIQGQYIHVGAADSDPEYVLQGMVYAMSFDVPVQVPTNPKAYRLLKDETDPTAWNQCAKAFGKVMKKIKKEFRTFYAVPETPELHEWLKVECWRYCRK